MPDFASSCDSHQIEFLKTATGKSSFPLGRVVPFDKQLLLGTILAVGHPLINHVSDIVPANQVALTRVSLT
jgi:hypothetical protein